MFMKLCLVPSNKGLQLSLHSPVKSLGDSPSGATAAIIMPV